MLLRRSNVMSDLYFIKYMTLLIYMKKVNSSEHYKYAIL